MEKVENISSTSSKKETFLAKLKGKQKNSLEDRVRHIKDAICAGTSSEEISTSLTNRKHNNYLYQQYEIVSKLSGLLNTCLERESLMHQVNNELIEAVKGMNGNNIENEILNKIKEFSMIHQESFQALRSAIDIWHEIRTTMEGFAQESQKINISYIIYDESECREAWMNIQNILKEVIGVSSNETVKTRLKDVSNQFRQICDTIEQKEKEFWRKQQQFSQITWKMQQLNNLSDCLMQEYKHNKSKVDDLVKFTSKLKKQLQKTEAEKLEMVEKLQQTKDFQNNEMASSCNGMQLVQTMKDELTQYRNTVNTLKTRINTLEQQLQDQQTSAIGFNDLLGLWQSAILQTKQINEDVEKGLEHSALNSENFQNSFCDNSGDLSNKSPTIQESPDDPGLSPDKEISGQAVSHNLKSHTKLRISRPTMFSKLPAKSVNCKVPSPKQRKRSKSPSPHHKTIMSPTRCKSPSEASISASLNIKYCPHTQSQCNMETCTLTHLQSEKEKSTDDVKESDLFNQKGKPKHANSYRLDVTCYKHDNELRKFGNSKAGKKKTHKFGPEDEKALKDQADWKLLQQLTDYEKKIYYLKDHLNHEKARHEAEVRKAENLFLRSIKHEDTSHNTTSSPSYEKQIHHLQDHLDHERLRHDAEVRKIEIAHKKQMAFVQKDFFQILKNINRFKENITNMFEKEQFYIDAQEMREIEMIDIGLEDGTGDIVTVIGRGTPRSLNIFNVIETKLLQALSHLKYLYNEEHLLSASLN